ncbi:MAG TPA: hypothetical protein VMB71_03480 [Acetobacteraceae bacterium]|nr:hypothetical protein [Acetobacteraceae bacterium]
MSRLVLILAGLLVGGVLIALLLLGAFPPKPHRTPVEHVIPNSQFKSP